MTQSILPHNIVNDTVWSGGKNNWSCCPSKHIPVHLSRGSDGWYRLTCQPFTSQMFYAPSLPAAKLEALRLVREAVLAEAEAWR